MKNFCLGLLLFSFKALSGPCDIFSLEKNESGMEVELRLLEKGSSRSRADRKNILSLIELSSELKEKLAPRNFSDLSEAEQHAFLQSQAKSNAQFYESRTFEGLHIRNPLPLRWEKDTLFLGKLYEAGKTHLVDISPLLGHGKIEYGEPGEVKRVGLLEFHFTSDSLNPLSLRDSVWTLLEGAGISKEQAHLHVMGALPSSVHPLLVAEYWARLNRITESISLVEKGFALKKRVQGADILMGLLDRESLREAAKKLELISKGKIIRDDDSFKAFYVGLHLPGKYKDHRLMGFQFRTLDKPRAQSFNPLIESSRRIFSSSQSFAPPSHQGPMLSVERLQKWFEVMKTRYPRLQNPEDLMALTASNATFPELIFYAPPQLRTYFETEGLGEIFKAAESQNLGVRRLLHNYANDPLFFDDKAFLEAVEKAQIQALEELKKGYSSVQVLRDFEIKSGLYERYLKSLSAAP